MSAAPTQPSLPWRTASSLIMGITGSLSRSFLFGLNNTEVVGLERFIKVLDKRANTGSRETGLITVSNHVSVLDDPLIWGVLPFRYSFNPGNHRWTLASYDLCFTNKALSTFFSLGQTLPTHRSAYSKHGGIFQPTMNQAIRLLSSQHLSPSSPSPDTTYSSPILSPKFPDTTDPFTSGTLTYSTNGSDTFPTPSAYTSRRHSWIHIFPEGFIHQHPSVRMRYFKWGVSRLILESEPLPTIIPIFIAGTENVMHESRGFPRFLPRVGKKIMIAFGEEIDGEKVFGDLRAKWKRLVELQKEMLRREGLDAELPMGELTERLKYGTEAVELRMEVTKLVRVEVLKLRKQLGYPEEDPKEGLVETWLQEGPKREGRMNDNSWVKDV